MTFTTLSFVLFFVSVFLVYWALPGRRSRNAWIVVASYFFYGWWNYLFCVLILASSLVDYAVARGMDASSSPRSRRLLLLTSLSFNVGLLGYFKYANFFIDSAVELANAIGWQVAPARLAIVLPVGISFYTFQTLSYTIDVYRRRFHTTHDLVAYLAYVSFFPQLVAGPIERATRLLPQFLEDRRFDAEAARDGLRQMLWGFVKKMVVADRLAVIVDAAYTDPTAAGGTFMAFATVCFAFQIYCDFSAYSDIAIGGARLFGIRLMRNFAYPFFSQSTSEFWQRWHISLATWMRDYVYVSLGGSRLGQFRAAFNVLITFALGGLWHGAGANFLCWGLICGSLVVLESLVGIRGRYTGNEMVGGPAWFPAPVVIVRMGWSFGAFVFGAVFFRADSAAQAVRIVTDIVRMLVHPSQLFGDSVDVVLQNAVGTGLIIALVAVEWSCRQWDHPFHLSGLPRTLGWSVYTLVIWATLAFAPQAPQPFIYFQF